MTYSPLSPPLHPTTPALVEGVSEKCVKCCCVFGTLRGLWSAGGLFLADCRESFLLSAKPVANALGVFSECHFAVVQSGYAGGWLVKSRNLIIDRNDYEEESQVAPHHCCPRMGNDSGDVRHPWGVERTAQDVEAGRPGKEPSKGAQESSSPNRGRPLDCLQQPQGIVPSRTDAGLSGQYWSAKPAQKSGGGVPRKPRQ